MKDVIVGLFQRGTRFRCDSEQHSGLKVNADSGGKANSFCRLAEYTTLPRSGSPRAKFRNQSGQTSSAYMQRAVKADERTNICGRDFVFRFELGGIMKAMQPRHE